MWLSGTINIFATVLLCSPVSQVIWYFVGLGLALGSPYSALWIPCIVRFPDLETDGEVTPRSGDENPFTGMRNIHSGHNENFFANGSVDQYSVAYLHGGPGLVVALPHSLKLASKRPSCNFK